MLYLLTAIIPKTEIAQLIHNFHLGHQKIAMVAQLPRNVYQGPDAPRTDEIALPTQAPGTGWEFNCNAERCFFLQKDGTMSAGNAATLSGTKTML
jgi:hypothetical protein